MIYKYRIFINDRDGKYFDLEGEKLTFKCWADTAQKNNPEEESILNSVTFTVATDNASYPEVRKQLKDCLHFFTPYYTEREDKTKPIHLIVDFYSYGYKCYINIDEFDSTNVIYNTDIQETSDDDSCGINMVTELTFRNK